MGAAAVALARAAGYVNAGTVELIAERDDPASILLPRDERAAAGRAPGDRGRHRPRPGRAAAAGRRRRAARRSRRTTCSCDGHAIEARIYAEDAGARLPAVGRARCVAYREPRRRAGRQRRSSRAREVGTDYDPMLAKVDRPRRRPRRRRSRGWTARSRELRRARRRRRTPPSCARCSRRPEVRAGRDRHRPDRAPRRRGRRRRPTSVGARRGAGARASCSRAPAATIRSTPRRRLAARGGARARLAVARSSVRGGETSRSTVRTTFGRSREPRIGDGPGSRVEGVRDSTGAGRATASTVRASPRRRRGLARSTAAAGRCASSSAGGGGAAAPPTAIAARRRCRGQ